MPKKISRRTFLRAAGAGAIAPMGFVGLGEHDADQIEVNNYQLKLPRWDANGFKVAFLADLHCSQPHGAERARLAVEKAVQLPADVLIIGGDFVTDSYDFSLKFLDDVLEPLNEAKTPVFAVMGNHDYKVKNSGKVIEALRRQKMRLLINEIVDYHGVAIAGIDDAIHGQFSPNIVMSRPDSKSMLVVLHEPDFVKQVPKVASLQLSGHSHGGQVCLPGGLALHTPRGAREYKSGFYPDANVPLFVTRGVGTVGMDVRLFCAPEVCLIELRSA